MVRTTIFIICATLWLLSACALTQQGSTGTAITPAQLAERISEGMSPLVLDVRTSEEYSNGHIPGALNLPHDSLPTRLDELPISRADEIVVHCRSGRRAKLAEAVLRESGYANVRALTGHYQAWQNAGLPTE